MDLSARLRNLPVFPLPRTVLMPSSVLPLHVFEPRYRALVADVLDSDGLMGVATLMPGYEEAYHDAPAVYPEIGVGKVVQSEVLPDGRSNLVLLHVASVRVRKEVTDETPYRVFHTEPVDEREPADAALAGIRAMVLQLAASTPSAGQEAARLVSVEGMDLVHSLAKRIFQEPDPQRIYLGSSSTERVRIVADALATLMAGTDSVGDA